jgi:hypothetical protein
MHGENNIKFAQFMVFIIFFKIFITICHTKKANCFAISVLFFGGGGNREMKPSDNNRANIPETLTASGII